MKSLRILLIVFNQVGRGTYWRAYHFGRCLAALGHQVTLMATAPKERWRIQARETEGMRLVEMPDLLPGALRSGWDPWATTKRLAWLRRQRFDLVHGFEARPVVIYPALAAQRTGAKLVLDWCDWFGRGGSVEERPSALQRALLRPVETYYEDHFRSRADATTVINRFLQERAVGLGVRRESVLLLRNGADTSQPVMTQRAARQAVGLPADGPILGFVGGLFTQDAKLMAAAFERVRQTRPEARLLLVGHFNRSPEALLQSSHGVVRTGPVPADMIPVYLSAADVCWLPLRDSGANRGRWPMKLTDYFSVGRPTVTTNVGELSDVVGQPGLGVATPDEPADFAAATLALLADEPRLAAMGQAARHVAEVELSWEKLTNELHAFYGTLLGG